MYTFPVLMFQSDFVFVLNLFLHMAQGFGWLLLIISLFFISLPSMYSMSSSNGNKPDDVMLPLPPPPLLLLPLIFELTLLLWLLLLFVRRPLLLIRPPLFTPTNWLFRLFAKFLNVSSLLISSPSSLNTKPTRWLCFVITVVCTTLVVVVVIKFVVLVSLLARFFEPSAVVFFTRSIWIVSVLLITVGHWQSVPAGGWLVHTFDDCAMKLLFSVAPFDLDDFTMVVLLSEAAVVAAGANIDRSTQLFCMLLPPIGFLFFGWRRNDENQLATPGFRSGVVVVDVNILFQWTAAI